MLRPVTPAPTIHIDVILYIYAEITCCNRLCRIFRIEDPIDKAISCYSSLCRVLSTESAMDKAESTGSKILLITLSPQDPCGYPHAQQCTGAAEELCRRIHPHS